MSTNNNTQVKDNEKIINKPISVARDELVEKLVNAANESGLPIYIIEYVARDFLNEVSKAATQQAEKERQLYQSELDKKES